jgi:hypothetical protein
VNERVAEVWLSRAAAEAGVHHYAQIIVADLEAIEADAGVITLAKRMLADEERHVRVCVEVASRFAGRELAAPPMRPYLDPFADVELPMRATLRVTSTCCIGESFACAWVDESARAVADPWLHDVLRKHLSDEIHHARVGWAHLATRSAEEKRVVAKLLPRLLEENLRAWRTFDPCWPEEGFPAHGLPSHADTMRWIDDARATLVLPGFEALGISPSA